MPKKSVNLSTDAIEKVEAFEKADSRSSFSNALEIIIHRFLTFEKQTLSDLMGIKVKDIKEDGKATP